MRAENQLSMSVVWTPILKPLSRAAASVRPTLASAGTLSRELAKRLTAAALGVRSGVDAAQILDLTASHAAIVELLTAQHVGTQVVSNVRLAATSEI